MEFDEIKKSVVDVVSNKKFQWTASIILFLIILVIGINIRIQPVVNENLIDSTTGDYTPLALDPYYFLRHSETLLANNGVYPEFDTMRSPHLEVAFHDEILPHSNILLWEIIKKFNSEATLNFATVLNPVIFFGLGLIIFFLLSLVLTRSRFIALSGSLLLAIIPPYLYRTLAGFTDHESLGMFCFFIALLLFSLGLIYLGKGKTSYVKSIAYGLIAGFSTILTIVSWGGIGKFLFMILPLAFLIKWLINKGEKYLDFVLFYSMWIVGILIGTLFSNYSIAQVVRINMLIPSGILTLLVLGYILAETLLIKFKVLNKKLVKYKDIISFGIVIVIGSLFYQIFIGDVLTFILSIVTKVLDPFKGSRLAQTVAEQKAPYLTELIGQVGKIVFYTFLAGCLIIGVKVSSGIKNKKLRPLFAGSFAFFVIGILFSKVSPSSIFDGDNFISKVLFFVSFLAIAISSIYIYIKSDWEIDTKLILLAAWMLPMLLAVRSAIRVFFAIVPFISIMVPFAILEIVKFSKGKKDELMKIVPIAVVIILSVLLVVSSFGYYNTVVHQASAQTPSYNSDWQKAMEFVRENTTEGSIFGHWWDYGYWVQTGGDRPTFSDGGHSQGDFGNHVFGRYVLTTPDPNSAKSFFKSNNISYLLIDPTDIGKYPAYSSIGTGKDVDDRSSHIVTLVSDPSETRETNNGTVRIYRGGTMLDSDLIYKMDGKDILLPRGKAGLGAILLEKQSFVAGNESKVVFMQPEGIYVYNGLQYRFPIRYIYIGNQLVDYKDGINATVLVYPNVYNGAQGQQFDQEGAAMYLSEKTKDSLVAKLYLMGDPDNQYEELELVHSEADYPFAFNYGGYRGPINIYKINTDKMDYIITHEEFSLRNAEYGLLDDFEFVESDLK
jgi:asparagine N-glycosylation enzyme membrane subunit Stt3